MSRRTVYPADLANAVWTALGEKKRGLIASMDVLTHLFETMYFTSLKTEESENLRFYVVYIDPRNPDPEPPQNPPHDRWSYVRFESLIEFTPTTTLL